MSDFIASRIGSDARIERSIFGTDDPVEIWEVARELCPEAVDCFAFRASVGALLGVRLGDGSRVALKVHVGRDVGYLEAVQRVQEHLWAGGFPCPRPLGVFERATLEEWRDEGDYRDAHQPEVRQILAEQMAELHRRTPQLMPVAGLEPYFPPPNAPLWPRPHNVLFDFEATAEGAEWIDEIALEAKRARESGAEEIVIGHGDWTATHFRFVGLRPNVIYDWDSLNADFEAAFVGGSAASFTYTEHFPVDPWPRADEAKAFMEEYERARGTGFTQAERQAVKAAAVYSRAYSARCRHAVGGDARQLGLNDYVEAFLGV